MEIVALPSLLDALLDPLLAPLLPYVFLLYMLFSISCATFTVNEGLKQAHLSVHPRLLGYIMNTVIFLVIPD